MKNITKWLLVLSGSLILVAIAVILMVPMLVNDKKIRSMTEKELSKAAGSPVKLEGDLRLSLFPWASIEVNGVHMENPPGFEEKYFLSAQSFNVQVRFMPLILSLFKDIRVKRFTLKGARIVMETRKDGRANWEKIGKSSSGFFREPKKKEKVEPETKPRKALSIKTFEVGEFAVTEGSLLRIDQIKGERFEVSDLKLRLKDVSLDRPIHIIFSSQVNGYPLSLEGDVGPLGRDLGKGVVPVNLSLNVLKHMEVGVKGSVTDAVLNPRFAMSVETSTFSPRKIASAMGRDFPIVTSDPKALTRLAVRADLNGDTDNVLVSDGVAKLDESTLNFSGKAGDFSRPNVTCDLRLDEIDLDRYLAAGKNEKSDGDSAKAGALGQKKENAKGSASEQVRPGYKALQRLVLVATVQVEKLKAANAVIQDIQLKIAGENGIFNLEPASLRLYDGNVFLNGHLNVRKDNPQSRVQLQAKGIQSGALLKDIASKDILEGELSADMALQMEGVKAERIIKSLNGEGNISIGDGAVKGIDLVAMVRNTDGAYGFSDKASGKAKTEFNEILAPFTIKNGVFYADNISMMSTLVQVQAKGKADLVSETLDFRIEPTFVTTRAEDVEKMKRSEVMIPVLVTGNLSDPKFRPDLRGIAEQKLEEKVFKSSKFKELFEKEELKPFEKDARNLLKGILGPPKGPEGEQ